MSKQPQWLTPNRKAELVKLLCAHLANPEGWKLDIASGEFYNPDYLRQVKLKVADWVDDDRYLWTLERKAIHSLGERQYRAGQFGSVGLEVYHSNQPLYATEYIALSGLTLTPYARVRISSSFMRLYIDLADSLKGVSKNQRHKAIRYGKRLPELTRQRVAEKIRLAVRDYLNS